MTGRLRSMWCGLLVLGFVAAAGCSSYVIKGTVIPGAVSDMSFVESNDSRLREPPLTNVRITVQRNPDDLARQMVGTDISDAHGRFVISLDEFGAGWMDEVWLIRATKPGFKTATTKQRLDAGKKQQRLLVIMAPGRSSAPQEDEDLMEQYREYR
ncbi:MAG: carboxypeptidase-like regulatory domain-containing protein [Planctomycetota bacterium]